MKLKIIVDFDLCEGNALCVKAAPTVFQVDETDMLQILQETVPEDLRVAVETAERKCPKGAITIVSSPSSD
jgi:ferredoxin